MAQLGLSLVLDRSELAVWAARDTPTVQIGANGIVVGRIFRRGQSARIEGSDDALSNLGAQSLTDDFWGDYVALTAHPDGTVCAVRAPSGGVHAFRTRYRSSTYIASDVEILDELGLIKAAIDWDFVGHHLAFSHLHTGATGLCGVDELLAGDCARWNGEVCAIENLWTPWKFAGPEHRVACFDDAQLIVRNAVIQAVGGLVEPGAAVALELSGGLDSSIVAAALAELNRKVIAINLSTPGAEGDERHYARAVGDRTGIPLVERPIEGVIDLALPASGLAARPGMLAMLRPADEAFAAAAQGAGVTGFINGTGGDCVFCSLGTAAPATDLLRANGSSPDLASTVRDVARVHDSNVWTVMRLMLRRPRTRRPDPVWRRNSHFLNENRMPLRPAYHPWLDEPTKALGGKRAHIHAILASYSHLDGYGRHSLAPSIFPLLAQPVVEACAAIPTWLWVKGGRDRSVAREAFRLQLPAQIINRRTKGAMDAFCARTFDINRGRLKPFLLDGELAAAGFLDRAAIEAYLSAPFANRDQLFYHLLPIIDAEAWAGGVIAASSR